MTLYRYTGPMTALHLPDRELMLRGGLEAELPDDHPQVRALRAAGHLTEIPPPRQAPPDPDAGGRHRPKE